MSGHTVSPSDLELMQLYDDAKYAKDDLTRYQSMRDNDHQTREQYLKSVDLKRKVRLEHERDRIAKLRVKFFSNKTKQELVASHERRRQEWRKEAIDNRVTNLLELKLRKEVYDASNPELGETRTACIKGFRNEERILNSIERWKDDSSDLPVDIPQPDAENEKLNYGLKACIMHFKKGGGGHTHKHKLEAVAGEFPNQKVPIKDFLTESPDNPLREPCKDGMIRYFHLPTNNMAWIEKVLALYYDEDLSTHDSRTAPHKRGPAERLLAREYWKGQMHGGSEHPVHARHMRPRCSSVPSFAARTTSSLPGSPMQSRRTSTAEAMKDSFPVTTQQTSFKSSQNFALFMPYLHWETNSRRAKMAELVVEETIKTNPKSTLNKPKTYDKEKAREGFFRAVQQSKLQSKYKKLPRARSKCLGPYLMSIAKIVDAMDYEADERLLRDHLHATPPLHIRRTLDQSYFWTLEDTTSRDRDQVVYRGTKGGNWKNWNARVVMVDQLWLWVLDDHTIFTSFPRRWGRNKPDPSGVHKSLRQRLNHVEDDRINSVYDLALIIIDQCSQVFFDRTKPIDERPEVMDIFSNAIAHVTGMKTVAFETFWAQMSEDSLKEHLQEEHSPEKSAIRAYLNVNPEGALLRESQDIVEELRMMSRIFAQQYQVVKDFKKALEKLNEREDRDSVPIMSGVWNELQRPQYCRVPKSTIVNAAELLEQILERKTEISELEEAAKRTSQQLQDLLALKQQQASIIEARMALKRADLSVDQGRSIMLFTIVTILFLPLSFFTGIFGMNNREWEAKPMSLHHQFIYMFPISFAVIIVSLLLAFSGWSRSLWKMLVALSRSFLAEYTPILWIKEHVPLSSAQFGQVEQKALKRLHQREQAAIKKSSEEKSEKSKKKHDRWVKGLDDKRIHEQIEKAMRKIESLRARNAFVNERSWRGTVNGHTLEGNEESIEVFGKGTDVNIV